MCNRLSLGFVIALLVAGAGIASAQRLEFDVASIRPTVDDTGRRGISFSPSGRFAWRQMTLEQLMESAFAPLATRDIAGGPSWMSTARFDIAATSAEALSEFGPDGTPIGVFSRLRTLLEDRFALKTHVELREMAVFALEPAAPLAAPSRGLQKVDVDCQAVIRQTAAAGPRPVAEGQLPLCAFRTGLGAVRGHAMTLSQLADVVSVPAGRPVVDRSGLTGVFDIELKWTPDLAPGALINGQPAPPSDGPSIFTAVREQLGLRLQPARALMPVLVVDAVSMPTPD